MSETYAAPLGGGHPFFALALHRAARVKLHRGEITAAQADQINDAISHPMRRDDKGNTCNLMDEVRRHTSRLAQATPDFQATYGIDPFAIGADGFDWSQIEAKLKQFWAWFVDHLPQILECIASLITIFMFFV